MLTYVPLCGGFDGTEWTGRSKTAEHLERLEMTTALEWDLQTVLCCTEAYLTITFITSCQHQTSSRNSDGVTPCGGAKYRWAIKISDFLPISRYISQSLCYYGRRIGTSIYCLSNAANSNDREWTLTPFSRSHHSLMLNISQTATDAVIVTICVEGE